MGVPGNKKHKCKNNIANSYGGRDYVTSEHSYPIYH